MRTQQLNSLACAVAVLAICSLSSAQVTKDQEDTNLGMEAHVGKLTGHAKDAAMNYRRYCAGCHGDLGDGEGENAVWLDPKPRNFTLATFKCRSTPSGSLPTDEDLYETETLLLRQLYFCFATSCILGNVPGLRGSRQHQLEAHRRLGLVSAVGS